jgi:ABC-type uncharacterized transport system substrate-binding protein
MRRRDFVKIIVGSTATWSLTARAQQIQGLRRVAILTAFAETEPEVQRWFAAFVQQLRDLGWIEGANIQIDTHWATADVGRLNRAAMELIDRKPDVILAIGPLTVAALRPMTSKIPVVFTGVADPVGTGLVASLAQPGGNITGFTLGEFAMSGKLLEALKQVAPQVSRITVIYYPQQVPQVGRLGAIQTAAPALGLQVSGASVSNTDEITRVIESLGTEPGRGVIVLPSVVTIANRGRIIALMARYRISRFCPGRRLDFVRHRQCCAIPPSGLLCRSYSERSRTRRTSSPGANEVRAYCQSQDRQGAWSDNSAVADRHRRRGDRITTVFTATQNVRFWHKADMT